MRDPQRVDGREVSVRSPSLKLLTLPRLLDAVADNLAGLALPRLVRGLAGLPFFLRDAYLARHDAADIDHVFTVPTWATTRRLHSSR